MPETGAVNVTVGEARVSTVRLLDEALAVISRPPSRVNTTSRGPPPVGNGDPESGVSAPPLPTLKTEVVLLSGLAVASSEPVWSNATDAGTGAVVNGEPLTGVSPPEAATANIVTCGAPRSATARSVPSGLKATEPG